jgi:DNA/RNA endonuclease G (NUC1)
MKKLIFLLMVGFTSIILSCNGPVNRSSAKRLDFGIAIPDPGPVPSGSPNVIVIKHTYYTNFFDTLYRSEVMGKYTQTIQHSLITVDTSKNIDRKDVNTFKQDPLIPARFEDATNAFYKKYDGLHKLDGLRVDKGHVNTYTAFAFDLTAAQESMYLQNTCPQYSFFNEHQWEAVEQYVIKQVSLRYDKGTKKYLPNIDNIIVYTGVLIKKNKISDGDAFIYIPDYYWKVISYKVSGKQVYEGWIGANTSDNRDTNPIDIKVSDVSKIHNVVLSYYPNFKLDF